MELSMSTTLSRSTCHWMAQAIELKHRILRRKQTNWKFNHTLIEKSCCILKHAKLPNEYWTEEIAAAVYLNNLTPTRVSGDKIPSMEFDGNAPSYTHLRTFGCLDYLHARRKRCGPISRPYVFVGYTATVKIYSFIGDKNKRLVVGATTEFQEGKGWRVEDNVIKVICISDEESDGGVATRCHIAMLVNFPLWHILMQTGLLRSIGCRRLAIWYILVVTSFLEKAISSRQTHCNLPKLKILPQQKQYAKYCVFGTLWHLST